MLPAAPKQPTRALTSSADVRLIVCVHELARALEEYITKEETPLYGGSIEWETAAIEIAELMTAEKCVLKS
jgi:hypothetical protein